MALFGKQSSHPDSGTDPANRALQKSQAQLAGIVDSAMDAIITIDEEQQITLFNAAAERMFGYISSMVVGRPIDILIPERYRSSHREHIDKFSFTGETSRSMGGLMPLHALRANGEEFAIEASISKAEVGETVLFTVIMREITERVASAKALADSQAQLAGIVGSAMDAIITVDENQRVTLFNAAAERIFGYRAGVILGQPLDLLLPEGYRELHKEHIQRFGRTGVTTRSMRGLGTLYARRANGEEFPIEASISQIDAIGKKLYTVILRDVTEKIESEQNLKSTIHFLSTLLDSLPEAVIAFDSQGTVQFFNEPFEKLWGYRPQPTDSSSEFWKELAPMIENPEVLQVAGEDSGSIDSRAVLKLKDGRRIEHLRKAYSYSDENVARLSIFTDVSVAALPVDQSR